MPRREGDGPAMFVFAASAPTQAPEPGITRQVLGHDPHLMMVRVTFVGGAIGALHAHPHRQVTYVESGTFDATIGDTTRRIGPGDCYLVAPNVLHGVVAIEAGVLIDVFTPAREEFLT